MLEKEKKKRKRNCFLFLKQCDNLFFFYDTQEGIPIVDPNYYANITCEELGKILRPDDGAGIAPLLEERVKNLQQVGRILLDKFNGTFVECIKASENSAEKLLKIIVNNFECYRDEADFHGHRGDLFIFI